MKRFVAVMVVMVLVLCCVACVAEEKDSVKEECRKNIGLLYLSNKMNPEGIGRDKLVYGHQNLILYIMHDASDMFYAVYGMKNGDSDAVAESIIPEEKASSGLIKAATDAYIGWLNGKLTDGEYKTILMEMIGSLLGLSD